MESYGWFLFSLHTGKSWPPLIHLLPSLISFRMLWVKGLDPSLTQSIPHWMKDLNHSPTQSIPHWVKDLNHLLTHSLNLPPHRYNGYLPPCDKGRRRSKFVLHRRPGANGVKPAKHYVVRTPQNTQVRPQGHSCWGCFVGRSGWEWMFVEGCSSHCIGE